MQSRLKEIYKLLAIPLSLLVVSGAVGLLWQLLKFPEGDTLVAFVGTYFNRYGLAIVFVGALVEGFLIIGQYFPGGVIIFLGVVSAGRDPVRVAKVVAVVSLAFFISYFLNYLVGKHGWYRLFLKFKLEQPLENAKKKLQRHELFAVLSSYWDPNLASVTATAAGVLHLPLPRFLINSGVGIAIWNTFWGTLVAILGAKAFQLFGWKVVIPVVAMWIIVILIKYYLIDARKIPEML